MVIGKGDGVMREGGRYLYVGSDCAPLRPFHDRIVLGDEGLVTHSNSIPGSVLMLQLYYPISRLFAALLTI